MYATHATCTECKGEGTITRPYIAGICSVMHACIHCDGSGECDCNECVNTAAENAFSDMCESEPPLSADERHQLAWQQKQELRR